MGVEDVLGVDTNELGQRRPPQTSALKIIGVILIIVVLLVGVVIFWNYLTSKEKAQHLDQSFMEETSNLKSISVKDENGQCYTLFYLVNGYSIVGVTAIECKAGVDYPTL